MNLRAAGLRVYWALRKLIAPSLQYSQVEYERFLERYVGTGLDWVDLGCGHSILPSWRAIEERKIVNRCRSVVGVDYDLPSLKAHGTIANRLRVDISKLPLADGTFDFATANMVVEHLDDPEAQFREIHRILRAGGTFLLHTPNALGYGVLLARLLPESLKAMLIRLLEQRDEVDVFKTYYRANSEKRIRTLAARTGFDVVDLDLLSTDAVFSVIPPLALIELIWIRILMSRPLRSLRTNIIVVLRKSVAA